MGTSHMIYIRIFTAFLLFGLCSGCLLNSLGDSDRDIDSLSEAKQLWESHQIQDYSIEVKRICYCGGPWHYLMTVREDTVAQITDLESGEEFTDNLTFYNTIDEYFEWLEQAFEQDPEVLEVTFNPKYGYPSDINYDRSFQIADEEFQVEMSNFNSSIF